MVRCKVKKLGKNALHIIVDKKDGFREGMEVEVIPQPERQDTGNEVSLNKIKQELLRDDDFIMLLSVKIRDIMRGW